MKHGERTNRDNAPRKTDRQLQEATLASGQLLGAKGLNINLPPVEHGTIYTYPEGIAIMTVGGNYSRVYTVRKGDTYFTIIHARDYDRVKWLHIQENVRGSLRYFEDIEQPSREQIEAMLDRFLAS